MKTRILLLLVAVLASCDPRHRFECQPDIQPGGRIVALSRSPANNYDVVAGAETGGIFRSTDAGHHWNHVETPFFEIVDLQYAAADANVLIATVARDLKVNNGGGIWRSADGGKTWSKPPTSVYKNLNKPVPTHGYGIAFEKGSQRVYVGTEYGVALSTDNGVTWAFRTVDSKMIGLNVRQAKVYAVLSTSADHAVAATSFGMYFTENGGLDWKASPTKVSRTDNVRGLAASPGNANHLFLASSDYKIWFSGDQGQTWSEIKSPGGKNREAFIRCGRYEGEKSVALYYGNGVDLYQKKVPVRDDGGLDFRNNWAMLNLDHTDPSDLIFMGNQLNPLLLAGDGGVFDTPDGGLSWKYTGGGDKRLNALQITEAAAQENFEKNRKRYVYFGTQDNALWASEDGAKTWPVLTGNEGFSIQTKRVALLPAGNKMTFVTIESDPYSISDQNYANRAVFKAPQNPLGNPAIWPTDALDPNPPDRFVQLSKGAEDANGQRLNYFNVTYDGGGGWKAIGRMANDPMPQLMQISNPFGGAMAYQSVVASGTTKQGVQKIGLVRLPTLYGNANTPVERADLNGFGSLGIFPTNFMWYNVFAVDPSDPGHILIADVEHEKMKVSWDGGKNWFTDDALTDCVTDGGNYKFYEKVDCCPKIVVNCMAFNPDNPAQIAVGTRENGLFFSWDKGESWKKLNDTERIVNPSSIVFLSNDKKILVSSYGRGLWEFEPQPAARQCKPEGSPPKGLFHLDLRDMAIRRMGDIDSLLRGEVFAAALPPDEQAMPLRQFLAEGNQTLVLPRFTQYGRDLEPIVQPESALSCPYKADIQVLSEQWPAFVDLNIRAFLLGANRDINGLILGSEPFRVYSRAERQPETLTAPSLILSGGHLANPFVFEPHTAVEIRGFNFAPGAPGGSNAVRVYLDEQIYADDVDVQADGTFSVRIVPEGAQWGGMTLRVEQDNPDTQIREARFIQIRGKEEPAAAPKH